MKELNIIETVNYYEALRRLSEINGSDNLEEIAELTKRINNYIQNDKINHELLEELQGYNEYYELVICIKDIIYSVGNDDQTRIDVRIMKGECFKVLGYIQDTISFKSLSGDMTIRMKKKNFRYYFGVINSKGVSLKEFFNSKIFREMEEYEN